MSASGSSGSSFLKPAEFKGSLARNIVVIFVILSLLPVIIIGVFSTLRSRQILRDQAYTQLQSITRDIELKIDGEATASDNTLRKLIADRGFQTFLGKALEGSPSSSDTYNLRFAMQQYLGVQPETTTTGMKLIMILSPDGTVIGSTNFSYEQNNLSTISPFSELIGNSTNKTIFDPKPFFPGKLVIFNSRTIVGDDGNILATVIGATLSPIPSESIRTAESFFPTAKAYLMTPGEELLTYDEVLGDLFLIETGSEYRNFLSSAIDKNETPTLISYTTFRKQAMLIYGRILKRTEIKFFVEVPEERIYQQINLVTPLNIILLALSLTVVGVVVFTISTRLVAPLNQLVQIARRFTEGDWSQRARITRRDEIGLLAFSFNMMVEQLGELYHSLERKVEQRTEQIRMASEVAQIATSTTARGEIIKRTVDLLVERFGYPYARAFVLDEAGTYAILEEESGSLSKEESHKGMRIRVGNDSLVGWVAANNQARVIANVNDENYIQDPPMAGTLSQAAIPISVAGQTLGILDVQSNQLGAFDPETVSVLQTLANQIANGIQNIRLLESTEINLQETTLFYRTSRQVTLANDENEVLQQLINALGQTTYVTGIYTVQKDHLAIVTINDPRNPGMKSTTQGIALPLQAIAKKLSETNLILVENLNRPGEFENILSFFYRRGCQSAAIIPVQVSGKLSKIVIVASREKSGLSDTSLQPLANLLGMTSTTLERFELQKTLDNRLNELQMLSNISQAISGVTDAKILYEILHKLIGQRIGEDTGFLVALINSETGVIDIPYLYEGEEPVSLESIPSDEGLISHILRTRTSLVLNRNTERKATELGAKIIGKPAKSWLGVPLVFAADVIGAIVVQDLEHEDRFGEDIVSMIETIAPSAAIAIQNARLVTQLEEMLKAYSQERFLLNTHLANTPDFLYFKDSRGQYVRASRSFAESIGLSSPAELIGKTDFELQGQETGARTYQEEQDFLLAGETHSSKVKKQIDKEGNETFQLVTHIAMRDESGITKGLLGISRDITEMKKTEQFAQHTADQLLTAAEIARDTAGTLNLDELSQKAVNLVLSRFDFYHASIFLLDPLGEYAVLKESTGLAGERLKAAGHKLAVGSQSLVGQATAKKEPVVVNDVMVTPNYYPNPLLPDTRSELVIPLKIGERVLGVLDVQSKQLHAFIPQDIATLQILADQMATAIYNAELFARSQDTLVQHRLLYQITTAAAAHGSIEDALVTVVEGLRKAMQNDRVTIFFLNAPGDRLVLRTSAGYPRVESGRTISVNEGVVGKCARERRPILVMDVLGDPNYIALDEDIRSELAIPIIYSNELIGVLNLENPTPAAYDENDREILATLGNNLGTIINNIHLLEQIRQQVRRQQIIYNATSHIRRSVDMNTILETSAGEICQALGAAKAFIEIIPEPTQSILEDYQENNGHDDTTSGEEVG